MTKEDVLQILRSGTDAWKEWTRQHHPGVLMVTDLVHEVLVATGLHNTLAPTAYEKLGFERRHNANEWSKVLN